MGGSIGSVVGERFVRGVQAALENKTPFILWSASGGALAGKPAVADADGQDQRHADALSAAGLPFISVLTDPTMGGVSASFAFVGDVVIAEPKALIGFAGRG